VIAFALSFYIVWTFPWLRGSVGRRLAGLLFVAACLCMLGDYVWPRTNIPAPKDTQIEQPKRSTVQKITKSEPKTKGDNKRLDKDLEKIEKREIPEVKLTVGASDQYQVTVTWGLKSRAIFLSYQIFKFLKNREHNEPDMEKKDINYLNETMSQYSSMFENKVISIRNEFADQKKQDKELDKYYKHPMNPIEINTIAERIEALADQL